MSDSALFWRPRWQLPAGVHAFVTSRRGPDGADFNLAAHTGGDPAALARNRQLLQHALSQALGGACVALQWVRQVHGTGVLEAGPVAVAAPEADAIHTICPSLALGVLTADCLPVLLSARDGSEVAVAHAGWRGLLAGVLEASCASFRCRGQDLLAWLGPAIGPCHFEVGAEVREAFLGQARSHENAATVAAFTAAGPGKWYADLYALARLRLQRQGVPEIAGEALCTCCHGARFFSWRKERTPGRFATLILRTAQ